MGFLSLAPTASYSRDGGFLTKIQEEYYFFGGNFIVASSAEKLRNFDNENARRLLSILDNASIYSVNPVTLQLQTK